MIQATLATLAVVGVTLALFASGKVRASKRATKVFMIAMIGYLVFALINVGLMIFNVPIAGGAFGLYVHAQHDLAERAQAAQRFRRAIGLGPPLRSPLFADVRRHAIMLYMFDARRAGASLRDMAAVLLEPAPSDWRTSSVRSDLRRLAAAAERYAAQDYRKLLR